MLFRSTVPIDLFPLYKSDYLDNNLSKMLDVDKVNWILCNTRFKEAFELAYSNPSELTEEEKTTEKAASKR